VVATNTLTGSDFVWCLVSVCGWLIRL